MLRTLAAAWLLTVGAQRATAQGCPIAFGPRQAITSGAGSYCVAAGDINADGRLDLVTANSSANSLAYWLGQPAGGFSARTLVNSVTGASCVAIANVTGGPSPDLIATNFTSSTLTLWTDALVGGGGAALPTPTVLQAGPSPFWVVAADLNNDGRNDLAVANFGASTVSLLIAKPDGSFEPRRTVGIGSGSLALVAADFNGDGRVDLAAGNFANFTISVLLNTGNANFAPRVDYACGGTPRGLTAADVNGDSRPDLLCANNDDGSIAVLLCNADGTFAPAETFDVGVSPQSIGAGDLNNDGWTDLVVANFQSGTLSVLPGLGNGRFRAPLSVNVGSQPACVVLADLSRDGLLDVACAGFQSEMSLLTNQTEVLRFTLQPEPASGAPGSVVRLTAAAASSGTSPLSYRWFRGDTPVSDGFGVSGSATNQLSLGPALAGQSGVYRLRVSNGCGAVFSNWTYAHVPACLADLNASGLVDVTDLYMYLDAWFAGCP